jgi:HSP20 family protein
MVLIKADPTPEKPAFSPWGLDRDFRRLFGPLLEFPADWEHPLRGGELFPAVDISETPKEYILKAETPGLDRKDIRLSLHRNVLTLAGEKRAEARRENLKVHRVESYSGAFQRSFTLPDAVQADRVSAAFKDGVLTVTVPKSEEARERDVEIQAG